MSEAKQGYDLAIEKVIRLLEEEAKKMSALQIELACAHKPHKEFHYKALALMDFKSLLEQLFKMVIHES